MVSGSIRAYYFWLLLWYIHSLVTLHVLFWIIQKLVELVGVNNAIISAGMSCLWHNRIVNSVTGSKFSRSGFVLAMVLELLLKEIQTKISVLFLPFSAKDSITSKLNIWSLLPCPEADLHCPASRLLLRSMPPAGCPLPAFVSIESFLSSKGSSNLSSSNRVLTPIFPPPNFGNPCLGPFLTDYSLSFKPTGLPPSRF